MVEYNTIIIGSGISGMSCAIYLKRAGINVLVIENNAPGGQLNKASMIENYPGYTSINGTDLAMSIFEQVNNYDVQYEYGEIIHIDYENKILKTKEGCYQYKYLVFATGRRERLLELSREKELLGKGLSLCATCDGALYKDQDVIVVGGGSSAVSEAIYLSNICSHVYLIYRGESLRSEEILKSRLSTISNVEVLYSSEISSYLESDGKVEGVELTDGRKINSSCIFLAIGHVPNSELFIGKKEKGYIIVDNYGRTSVDSVYACGDVIKKDLYQLITAANEGVVVANDIIHSL